MEKIKIPERQMQAMLALFLAGSSFISGGASLVRQDSWFCLIAAYALSILLCWVYAKFLELYDSHDFFDCVLRPCGRATGTVVCALYGLFALHLTALVLRIFIEYIHSLSLTDTPPLFIAGCIVVVAVYTLRNRLPVLARISRPLLAVFAILLILTVFLAQKSMHLDNIKPVLHRSFADLSAGTFLLFAIPFGDIVLFLPAFGSLERGKKPFRVLLKGDTVGFLLLLVISLRNTLILGYSESTDMFPSYNAASVINVGDFIFGVDVIVGSYALLAEFVRIGILLYTASRTFATVFRFRDYKPILISCGMLVITMSEFVHRNTSELFSFVQYYPVYSFPMQVAMPLLFLIAGTVRSKIGSLRKTRRKPPRKVFPS